MIDAAHPAIRAVNDAQIILTLGTGAVEVFEHGWRDSPSHPLGCQGERLEAERGVRGCGSGEGERTGEDRGAFSEGASLAFPSQDE